jgi:glutamine amidotransferase
MIAIIDYGAGNLFSLKNTLDFLGADSLITKDSFNLEKADGLILPGVGAFPDAMEKLAASGLIPSIRREAEKKPLLGICLGMQILFERGFEFRETQGLGLLPGSVRLMETGGLKLPHIGWNSLHIRQPSPLTTSLKEGDYVYFVHSYAARCPDGVVLADTDYGKTVPALVGLGQVFGAQFHPEKSGSVGLGIIESFCRLVNG